MNSKAETVQRVEADHALTMVLRDLQYEKSLSPARPNLERIAKSLKCEAKALEGFLTGNLRRTKKKGSDEFGTFRRDCYPALLEGYGPTSNKPDFLKTAFVRAYPEEDIIAPVLNPLPTAPTSPSTPKVIAAQKQPSEYAKAVSAVADLFTKFDMDGFEKKQTELTSRLKDRYYNVFRWAGPSDSNHRARTEPRLVRAVVKFTHPAGGGFLRFNLGYQPRLFGTASWKTNPPYVSEGVVLPVGNHVLMVGVEERTLYPITIWTSMPKGPPQEFSGLVTRRADTKAQIISAKARFSVVPNANAGIPLEAFRQGIGISFREDLESLLGQPIKHEGNKGDTEKTEKGVEDFQVDTLWDLMREEFNNSPMIEEGLEALSLNLS